MFKKLNAQIHQNTGWSLEWFLLGLAMVAAYGVVITDNSSPPLAKLILVVFLYVFTINMSVPIAVGYVGLAPIVAISSLLDSNLGLEYTLLGIAFGVPLAEMVRPFWQPLWQFNRTIAISWRQRLSLLLIHLLNAGLAGLVHEPLLTKAEIEGQVIMESVIQRTLSGIPNITEDTFVPILLTAIYFVIYVVLRTLLWRVIAGGSLRQFLRQTGISLLTITFFGVPLTLFIASAKEISVPAFVFLSISIATFAVITQTSWHRNDMMRQRLYQFSSLNTIGSSLRETLDLPTVLAQIHQEIEGLIPADRFFLALVDEEDNWEQPVVAPNADGSLAMMTSIRIEPDDLTRWVVENNHVLELDSTNLFHAERRKMKLPPKMPKVWLGVPLNSAEKTIGAMVLQKSDEIEPFTQWNQEVLLAVAGQASAAIQNARLHSETVRLYNLTDEALARRVEQLQALLDSITEGVLMVDATGQIVLINPTGAQLLNRQSKRLRGTHLNVTTASRPLGYTPIELKALLGALERGENPTPRRHTYETTTDDKRRYFERNEVAVTSDEAQLMGWLMVFRDITEERERAEWRADLTRMIVHDLRNPITTITSTVSTIKSRLPNNQYLTIDDLISNARYGCANMLEMVDSLLDINRAQAGKFIIDAEAMRLPQLADRVQKTLRPLAEQRGIELTISYPEKLPAVWADEEIMRRVLVNLVDNALKFTPRGGRVRGFLETEVATGQTHEDGLRVTIYDDGPGIKPDQRELIFDRFVTFNRGGGQVRGTGLGLTFCKLAVEAHEGKIWVEDAPKKGSAFIFTVPGIPIF